MLRGVRTNGISLPSGVCWVVKNCTNVKAPWSPPTKSRAKTAMACAVVDATYLGGRGREGVGKVGYEWGR